MSNRTTRPKSYQFPPQTITQIEDVRHELSLLSGVNVRYTDVVIRAVAELHASVCRKKSRNSEKVSEKCIDTA